MVLLIVVQMAVQVTLVSSWTKNTFTIKTISMFLDRPKKIKSPIQNPISLKTLRFVSDFHC